MLPLRFSMRSAVSTATVCALLAMPALAQAPQPDCTGLIKRFDQLIARYVDAGSKAIEKDDPGLAVDRARAEAIKGKAQATVVMIGVPLIMRGRQDVFAVSMVRQVCTFAERNGLLLHVVSCAYFAALNPIGEKSEKRRLVEAELARFDRLQASAEPGGGASRAELSEHMDALKVCLPRA